MPQNLPAKSPSSVFSRMGISARRWMASFVRPSREITQANTYMYGADATTVAALLGTGRRAARSRQQVYEKWASMEGDGIISTALKLQVTAALGGHETTGQTVFIEKTPETEKNAAMAALVDEVSAKMTPLLNSVAFTQAYVGASFGDAYARVYCDAEGVSALYTDELVRPPVVQPYERGSRTVGFVVYLGERNFERLDTTQMVRLKMPRTQWIPQHGVVEKALRLKLTEDSLDALPIMPSMAGGSFLYNAEEAYDNLYASLLGLVGQRWLDSIDEQMVTVNLESMTMEQQKRFTNSIVSMFQSSKRRAEEAVSRGRPVMERIRHILPVFNEKQATTVAPMNGGQVGRASSLTIDDVMLHARLLAGSLGVDLSMLGFADQLSGGLGEGGFFRMSAQIAESARVIRGALEDFFEQILDIHTLKRYGYVFPRGERPWKINFYGSISAMESEKQRTRMEAMNSGLLLAQGMQLMKDIGATEEMMEQYLAQQMALDEDQAKLFAGIVKTKSPDEAGDDGGGFGGGGGGGGFGGGKPDIGGDKPQFGADKADE